MKIELKDAQKSAIDKLILMSFESEIYLVKVDIGGQRYQVCESGKPKMFRSQLMAKIPFKGIGINHTVLVHESPYAEMIGLDGGKVEPMEVKIQSPDDDFS